MKCTVWTAMCLSCPTVIRSFETDVKTRCEQEHKSIPEWCRQSAYGWCVANHKLLTVFIIEAQSSINKAHMVHALCQDSCQWNSLSGAKHSGKESTESFHDWLLVLVRSDHLSGSSPAVGAGHQKAIIHIKACAQTSQLLGISDILQTLSCIQSWWRSLTEKNSFIFHLLSNAIWGNVKARDNWI